MSYDNPHEETSGAASDFSFLQFIDKASLEAYPDLSTPDVQHIISLILEDHPLLAFMQDENLRYLWALNMPEIWKVVDFDGKTENEITLPEDIKTRLEALKREVLKTGKSARIEGWLSNLHGVRVYTQITLDAYMLPTGKRGILGKILDLTEQQVAKEALTALTKRQEARNNQAMADNRRLFLENERNRALLLQMELQNKGRIAELLEAQVLQIGMLPTLFPNPEGFEIVAYMAACMEVGGDYYDFSDDGKGGYVAALGDATGHGTRAGIIVSAVKSYFQILACQQPLAEVLRQTSRGLKKMNVPQAYMGLSLLEFKDHTFRYASAGMPPLLIYRQKTGKLESLQVNSMFLGTHIKKPYQEFKVTIDSGDIAIMLSDGFTETMNPENEILKPEDVEDCILANAHRGPQGILDAVVHLQHTFSRQEYLKDDSSAVIIRRK